MHGQISMQIAVNSMCAINVQYMYLQIIFSPASFQSEICTVQNVYVYHTYIFVCTRTYTQTFFFRNILWIYNQTE